jgi:hypothetical protein
VLYEVTAISGTVPDVFDIPVYVANEASPQPTDLNNPVTIAASYAPVDVSGDQNPLSTPRFNMTPITASGFVTITLCQTELLFPFVTTTLGFDTFLAIANTATTPDTPPGVTGTCTFNFYGAIPQAPFTTPPIPSGTIWSGGALSMNAWNFTGYAIAVCAFQPAHGFASISDSMTYSLGLGSYLPLVLNR